MQKHGKKDEAKIEAEFAAMLDESAGAGVSNELEDLVTWLDG